MTFGPVTDRATVNTSLAGIADQMISVKPNPALQILLDRFDSNSTATNFTALLRGVEKAMTSSGFQRKASVDLAEQLRGEYSGLRADLGLAGSATTIGSSVVARTAYSNLIRQENDPTIPTYSREAMSMDDTLKRLGTTRDALAETIAQCANPDVAKRVLSQILTANIIQFLVPDEALTKAGAKRELSMEGVNSVKYNSLLETFTSGAKAANVNVGRWLYPSNDGLPLNTALVDGMSSEIQAQAANGWLNKTQLTDLNNLIKLIQAINGPSPEKLLWRDKLLAEQNAKPTTTPTVA